MSTYGWDEQAVDQEILYEVRKERQRQHEKWGEQNHPDVYAFAGWGVVGRDIFEKNAIDWKQCNDARVEAGTLAWDGILLEEAYEALAESDPERLREELIQVAAVAVSWVGAIDRRQEVAA